MFNSDFAANALFWEFKRLGLWQNITNKDWDDVVKLGLETAYEHTLNVFRNFLKKPQPQFTLFDYVGHSNDFRTLNFRDQQSFRPSGVKIS